MTRRVQNEPAWLLHHRPYRDTSRILDVLSREYGRLSMVARGSRAAKSRLGGILRPFLPLNLSWVIRGDLGTLTGADLRGHPISLTGDALLSGYYVNELLLHFLHRHDPQPEIFEAYTRTVEGLAANRDVPAVLRRFEMELLGLLGYGLILDHDTQSQLPLAPAAWYEYRVEQGPVEVAYREDPLLFSGAELKAIGEQHFEDAQVARAAGRLLRHLIAHHLDGRELKSRRVLIDMRRKGEAREQNVE